MLTRRDFLAAATAAAGLAVMPSRARAQAPRTVQRRRADAVPPTSPNPVSARPPDNLGGSTINVGGSPGDLQKAINASSQGDTLLVPAGVTYDEITLPARTGSGWTCIRTNSTALPADGVRVTPSDTGAMFKVVSGGSSRAVIVSANTQGWRIIGMEATHPSDTFHYSVVDVFGTRTSFERCYVHARTTQPCRRCFWIERGSDLQIWDSYVSEAKEAGSDAQALASRNFTRCHIENCELQGTGENILVDDQGSPGVSTDITIKRNHLFKPLTWRKLLANRSPNPSWDGTLWTIKNHFEIKWGHRVLFEGNVCENNWAQGQDGTSLLINTGRVEGTKKIIDAQDVLYQSNIIKNAPYMLSWSDLNNGSSPPTRIAFRNNLGLDIGGRAFFLNHRGTDYWIEHNSVVPQQGANSETALGWPPSAALMIAWDYHGAFPRFTFKHNVFGPAQYGIWVQGLPTTTATLDLVCPDRSWALNAEFGVTGSPPADVSYYPTPAAAGVNTGTGRLNSRSPLIHASADGTDLGVNFTQLDAAQMGR